MMWLLHAHVVVPVLVLVLDVVVVVVDDDDWHLGTAPQLHPATAHARCAAVPPLLCLL